MPEPPSNLSIRRLLALVVTGLCAVMVATGCGRTPESSDPLSHVPTQPAGVTPQSFSDVAVAEPSVALPDGSEAAQVDSPPENVSAAILGYLETGEYPEDMEVGSAPVADQVKGDENGASPEVTWDDLYTLDVETGSAPPSLAALDGQPVRIPGFMVPLDDAAETVSEFLLVPYAGACIHVPPPPPNQIVHVTMTGDATSRVYWWDPIWIHGVLNIESVEHAYGQAAFTLEGTHTEVYSPDG